MTSEAKRPDFDRLDDVARRLAERESGSISWRIAAETLIDTWSSIRDYVKELEGFYAEALQGIRDGEAARATIHDLRGHVKEQDERIERLEGLREFWLVPTTYDEADEAFQLRVDLDTSAKFAAVNRSKYRPGTTGHALWVSICRVFDFANQCADALAADKEAT
jgi:hypothetical protein